MRGGTEYTKVVKQADGTYKLQSATITIYEGSVNKTADKAGYAREGVFAGTSGHEIDHATDQSNVNMVLQNRNKGAKNDVEAGPNATRDLIIQQYEAKQAAEKAKQ